MQINRIYEEVEKIKKYPDFIDFTQSNFTDLSVKFPEDVLHKSSSNYFDNRHYEPDSKGLLVARESISSYYEKKEGRKVDPENIVITSSTSESYNLLFSLFTNPGDEILLPSPTYPLFSYFAELNKIDVKFYNFDPSKNWEVDIDSVMKKISEKTKFIVLISPNNPTGQILSQNEFDQICEIAHKKNIYLILDEVFSEFVYSPSKALNIDDQNIPLIFRLNGISKMFALPDLKLSWINIVAPKDEAKEVIEKLEIANDAFLNANYLVQSMLPSIFLEGEKYQQELREELSAKAKLINEGISKHPKIKISPINGGIHLILSIEKSLTKLNEEEVVIKLLQDSHILVHPGYFYDYSDHQNINFVITIFNVENIEKLLIELEKIFFGF